MRDIDKSFYGIKVLERVTFSVRRGEVHVLVGENGAGKSTLMKILSGAYSKDAGQIVWEGRPLDIDGPLASQRAGISIMYQEFNLLPEMTVAENMFLGREPRRWGGLFVDEARRERDTRAWLAKVKVTAFHPDDRIRDLTVAEGQFVSVAQALSQGARLIVMDEPTASLTRRETETLFELIRDLKRQGISTVFISHHLDELFEIGDRITVLRDGRAIQTLDVPATNKGEIISLMVGRELKDEFPPRQARLGEAVLEVAGLSRQGVLSDISFSLRRGEILGVAGLVGAGRTEMIRCIFGADPKSAGEVRLFGKAVTIESPRDSIRHRLGLLPEERKRQGVLLDQSVRANITLANLGKVTRRGLIDGWGERSASDRLIRDLQVKTASAETPIKNLSGGNQQKAIIAKWLFSDADILIFDEPTRGIDVGAKYEVYKLMCELTAAGKSIIMVSSDLPEIIGMSDRVLVMHQGRISGEFDRSKEPLTQEKIMAAATGEPLCVY